jgi:hypothetical protein
LPDDQYFTLIDVLLDKLRAEAKTARKLFYAAHKAATVQS